jgi:hypothetical protein
VTVTQRSAVVQGKNRGCLMAGDRVQFRPRPGVIEEVGATSLVGAKVVPVNVVMTALAS